MTDEEYLKGHLEEYQKALEEERTNRSELPKKEFYEWLGGDYSHYATLQTSVETLSVREVLPLVWKAFYRVHQLQEELSEMRMEIYKLKGEQNEKE